MLLWRPSGSLRVLCPSLHLLLVIVWFYFLPAPGPRAAHAAEGSAVAAVFTLPRSSRTCLLHATIGHVGHVFSCHLLLWRPCSNFIQLHVYSISLLLWRLCIVFCLPMSLWCSMLPRLLGRACLPRAATRHGWCMHSCRCPRHARSGLLRWRLQVALQRAWLIRPLSVPCAVCSLRAMFGHSGRVHSCQPWPLHSAALLLWRLRLAFCMHFQGGGAARWCMSSPSRRTWA